MLFRSAEAKTGREAVSITEQLKPDIVVMDISMPDLNGLEAARRIKKPSSRPTERVSDTGEVSRVVS